MKRIICLFAVTMFSVAIMSETRHIKILSVNDMHAAIDNMPRLKSLVDSLRAVDPELIVLSCGDNRTGNPYNDKYPQTAMPMAILMNEIGFDASAVGNHEWDSRQEGFRNIINNSRFHYLCANAFIPDTCRIHLYPYKIMERHGVRIGLLGGIQVNSAMIPDAHPDNMKGITFLPIDKVIPDYTWMRDQTDVLVLLSHDGYEVDTITAHQYPFFDAIIGGHSHVVADNECYSGVLVNQAGSKLRYANITDIDVEDGKVIRKSSKLLKLSSWPQENKQIREIVDRFKDNPFLKEVIAHVASPFQSAQELGCMEMDALREELGVDVAIQNGGGVRFSTFPVGEFTVGDLLSLDPFGNAAVVYEMTGKELEDFIMNNLDVDEKGPVYVSGCTYEMTVRRGAKKEDTHPVGIKIKMEGKKFSPTDKYTVVTNSYAASVSTSQKADPGTALSESCSDITMRWLRKQPPLNYTGVKRIKIDYIK